MFGGCTSEGNDSLECVPHNDVVVANLTKMRWVRPDVRGNPPSARRGHCCVVVADKLLIYGGIADEGGHVAGVDDDVRISLGEYPRSAS